MGQYQCSLVLLGLFAGFARTRVDREHPLVLGFMARYGSADEAIIFRVGTNPEPDQTVASFDRECPMTQADANRAVSPHFLEVERGVSRVGLQKNEGFVGEAPYRFGECPVAGPEIGSGEVLQSSVVRPASCARRAFSARVSSFPLSTSA